MIYDLQPFCEFASVLLKVVWFDDNCAVSAFDFWTVALKEVAKGCIYLINKFIDATYFV
jgi:hypothetical protein